MKLKMKGSGMVTIDGNTFTGNSIIIDGNGNVTVDGVEQERTLIGNIDIKIEGDVERLELSRGTVNAQGVERIKTVSGDVICKNVSGDVGTVSGDITCDSIAGNAKTVSGDIKKR